MQWPLQMPHLRSSSVAVMMDCARYTSQALCSFVMSVEYNYSVSCSHRSGRGKGRAHFICACMSSVFVCIHILYMQLCSICIYACMYTHMQVRTYTHVHTHIHAECSLGKQNINA